MSDRTIIRPGGRKPRKPSGERPSGQKSISKSAQQSSSPVRRPASRPDDSAVTENYRPPSGPSRPPSRRPSSHASRQPSSQASRQPYVQTPDNNDSKQAQMTTGDLAGINPVIHLTSPLLNVVGKVQCATSHPNMDEFKTYAVNEIAKYESQQFGLPPEQVDQISYYSFALCCLIDELVLTTPWGISSNWDAESLLRHFHGESWGGDKFFESLDEMMQRPSSNQKALEFIPSAWNWALKANTMVKASRLSGNCLNCAKGSLTLSRRSNSIQITLFLRPGKCPSSNKWNR